MTGRKHCSISRGRVIKNIHVKLHEICSVNGDRVLQKKPLGEKASKKTAILIRDFQLGTTWSGQRFLLYIVCPVT